MPIFSRSTLQFSMTRSSPFLRGAIYFFLSLILVGLAAEMVARTPLGDQLPAPSLQGDSFLFDAKVYRLEQQVRRDGSIDCIFIGSSVTNSDVDPETVERAYREQTGESIRCFNLGYPAMTIENASAFVDSVIAKFSPRLIVYTFIPRDLTQSGFNVDFLQQSPWLQPHPRDLHGWLIQNSHAYRYYQTWRYLLLVPNRDKRIAELTNLTAQGFQPTYDIREPYPETINLTGELLKQIAESEYARLALEQLLERQTANVRILLVEAPIYRNPSDAALWQVYESDYIPFIAELAKDNNTVFIRSGGISNLIPREHWYDHLHFNFNGAVAFSQWLGETLAAQRDLLK